MKKNMSEQDVLNLFSGIKNTEAGYPPDLIQSRRDLFAKQAAAMAVLVKAGTAGTSANASGSAQTAPATTGTGGISFGTLLETALMIALVVEAGVASYIYRDRIASFINSNLFHKSVIVVSPSSDSSSSIVFNETVSATETLTGTETVSATPPAFLLPAGDNGVNGTAQAISTPIPTDKGGLHLGLTKQPTDAPKETKAPEKNPNSNNNSP